MIRIASVVSAAGLVFLSAFPRPAHAWGATGHRIIGEIAEHRLGIRARACVKKLLQGESLAIAATWADEIRSEPKYARYAPWHYVEIPPGRKSAEIEIPLEGNAISALAAQEKILRDSKAAFADRANALRLIDHLIGDLHQPLHVGNGTDRGGNTCEVAFFGTRVEKAETGTHGYRATTNLHKIWDEGLIDRTELSYSEFARTLESTLTKTTAATYGAGTLGDWLDDSNQVADTIYPIPKTPSPRGPHPYCVNAKDLNDHLPTDLVVPNLGYEYLHAMQPTLNQQLQKGGVRLAKTLDRIFATVDCGKIVAPKVATVSAAAAAEYNY